MDQGRTESDKKKFQQLLFYYAQVQPSGVPDFNDLRVLKYWAMKFFDIPIERLKNAFDRHIETKRYFPAISEIKSLLENNKDPDIEARLITANISGAISKYGYNNEKEAKEFIGEKGWSIVTRLGGWPHLCDSINYENMSYMLNQIRETIKSDFISEKNNYLALESSNEKNNLQLENKPNKLNEITTKILQECNLDSKFNKK